MSNIKFTKSIIFLFLIKNLVNLEYKDLIIPFFKLIEIPFFLLHFLHRYKLFVFDSSLQDLQVVLLKIF